MMMSIGTFIIRMIVGLLFVGHGGQKLFGWFDGGGIRGTESWLGSLGLRPARPLALLAGISEFGGGILFALGMLNPLGSLGIIASMIMAIALVHWPKVWSTQNGFEYPLVNLAVASGIALTGPGVYSIDAVAGTALPMPGTFLIGLALIVISSIVILQTRVQKAGKQKKQIWERPAA